jgi:hypothetical protein
MITKLDPKVWEVIIKGTPDERKYICSESKLYFFLYYFSEYFTYQLAPFHYEMVNDLEELDQGLFHYLMWCMFRESAKTSIAKMDVVHKIAYEKKHYINWDSFDKSNAESALFDITQILQTNDKFISDFGQLFYEPKATELKKSTVKRLNNFVTANDIRVEAFSTQQSTRGRIYKQYRPDHYIIDDFETINTKDSLLKMGQVKKHIGELQAGLATNATVLFLCNLITEAGVVNWLMETHAENPNFKIRNLPVEDNGIIAWPGKYVFTDEEANQINKTIVDPNEHKISLESKERDLTTPVYQMDMMNNPAAAGDLFFDRDILDALIEKCKARKYLKKIGERYIYATYDPSHRYGIGADPAKGVKQDHNASAGIDFTTIPARQIMSFANNEIPPDSFAHELKAEGEIFGECIVAIEINGESGGTCVNEFKHIYDIGKIYKRLSNKPRAIDKPTKNFDLGWETNGATKPEMMFALKKAIEEGYLDIYDIRILKEARKYTQADLRDTGDSDTTRHFDLLKACAIAWKMKDFAEASKKVAPYVQKPYEGISDFETPTTSQPTLNNGNNFFNPLNGNPNDPFNSDTFQTKEI